jgi:hypothetical protein
MTEDPEIQAQPEPTADRSPITILMGCLVAAAILASIWFVTSSSDPTKHKVTGAAAVLKLGSPEEAYVKHLQIENITLSRAENFLHQEVTIVSAEITNMGTQPVFGLVVVTEFSDEMSQIVLREARPVLGKPAAMLAPGEKRLFEISFDNVPRSWNMRQPVLRISQLKFSLIK